MNDKIAAFAKQNMFASIISVVTNNKNELWKPVRLTSFQKPQLQSVSIFFEFFHPCLLLYLLCHFYSLLTFWALILMFHSVWRRCLCLYSDKFGDTASFIRTMDTCFLPNQEIRYQLCAVMDLSFLKVKKTLSWKHFDVPSATVVYRIGKLQRSISDDFGITWIM